MQKITAFLWFDNNAEEAIRFYTGIFKNSRVINTRYYGDGGPGPKGSLMTATIELEGQEFMLLNAGPMFKFTEAISFFVKCRDQEEVDYYWERLCEGGQPSQCGWLKDKFGLSWQIIPDALGEYLGDKDPQKASKVMGAMLKMSKIDVAKLKEAYEQA